jgi:hypothetical protein
MSEKKYIMEYCISPTKSGQKEITENDIREMPLLDSLKQMIFNLKINESIFHHETMRNFKRVS